MKMVKFISLPNDLAKEQHAMQLISFEDAFFFTTSYIHMTYVLVDGDSSYFNVSMLMI